MEEEMLRPHKQLTGPIQRTKMDTPPEQLFFLLHGWGADGANLLDIALSLSHDFPHAEFHLPNAPLTCEASENGYQWFSLSDESTSALLQAAESTASIVENYIREKTKQAQLDHTKVVLLGFSQGAMLAKHLALTRPNLCNVVAAYSGKLIDVPENMIADRVPMILIHGDEDIIIPVEAMVESYNILKELEFPVDAYRMVDLGHGINQAGLELGHQFIKKHLGLES
ncbi:MAG: dienelactone hydrolase family protein [Candidatus Paracaedibacteraceae bacterium]|nr:dienelactone hydrolase family protein [Candidatus Paracaedibacteraceae bacterium]